MSQSELARQLGVKPQAIQYLCREGKGSRHTSEIARILRVRPQWLASNQGPMRGPARSSLPAAPSSPNYIEADLLTSLWWLAYRRDHGDTGKIKAEPNNKKYREIKDRAFRVANIYNMLLSRRKEAYSEEIQRIVESLNWGREE